MPKTRQWIRGFVRLWEKGLSNDAKLIKNGSIEPGMLPIQFNWDLFKVNSIQLAEKSGAIQFNSLLRHFNSIHFPGASLSHQPHRHCHFLSPIRMKRHRSTDLVESCSKTTEFQQASTWPTSNALDPHFSTQIMYGKEKYGSSHFTMVTQLITWDFQKSQVIQGSRKNPK